MTNDDTETNLTAADLELARLLAAGMSYREAAEIIGLSKAAVYRRMRDPRMRTEVNRHRKGTVDELLTALLDGARASIAYLAEAVDDPDRDDDVRLKAAGALLGRLLTPAFEAISHRIDPSPRDEVLDDLVDQLST